ncbi:MAG: hypothetical protein LW870_16280 [Pirellula sp.]|jgi:hypothetical protein|nr:hypothetical protein [Pirellula sp.]
MTHSTVFSVNQLDTLLGVCNNPGYGVGVSFAARWLNWPWQVAMLREWNALNTFATSSAVEGAITVLSVGGN